MWEVDLHQEIIRNRTSNVYGFALIELVLIIGIIAFFISIMAPTFLNYRRTFSETVCKTNLITIKRLFEASIINVNSEISFNSFIEVYTDDICPD